MLIAVYGTLRRGDVNHERYFGDLEPLSTEMLTGFEMFNLGGQYPYITQGDGSVLCELYDPAPEIGLRVARMEMDAGYSVAEIKTSLGKAMVFHMSSERHERYQADGGRPPKILSGDWFEWLSKYKPERLRVAE